MELDEESLKKLFEALKEAQQLVLTQRSHMKPFFQAFDKTKSCYVTKSQFARVLSQVGLKPTEEILNLILKYYMNKGNLEEVNYVDFIKDVDQPEDVYLIAEKDISLQTAQNINKLKEDKLNAKKEIISRKPEDIEDVLALIRTKVKQERMRLGEFFRDFDKLRSGTITSVQYRIGLNMAKISLSNAEFDLLCQTFAAPTEGKILWKQFVDRIEEVFTQKHLEEKPTHVVAAAKTETKYGKVPPTEKQAAICTTLKAKFA
jgi:Ca2+-binding EF-hand superfamily protein